MPIRQHWIILSGSVVRTAATHESSMMLRPGMRAWTTMPRSASRMTHPKEPEERKRRRTATSSLDQFMPWAAGWSTPVLVVFHQCGIRVLCQPEPGFVPGTNAGNAAPCLPTKEPNSQEAFSHQGSLSGSGLDVSRRPHVQPPRLENVYKTVDGLAGRDDREPSRAPVWQVAGRRAGAHYYMPEALLADP
jgi:hypothetical protein